MNRKKYSPGEWIKYIVSLFTTRSWSIFAFAYVLVVRCATTTWMVEHPEVYMLTLAALCTASALYVIISALLLSTHRDRCKPEGPTWSFANWLSYRLGSPISRSRVDKVDKKCYSINRKVSLYDLIVNRKVSYFLHMENVPHYVIQAPLYFYTVVLFYIFQLEHSRIGECPSWSF